MKKGAVCPATKILTFLSKRHMLVILHALADKPRGFSDLQESLTINTATLSSRLHELEAEKLIKRISCPHDSRVHYYGLTGRGNKMSKLIGRFAKL
ncbi:helix-turn-helix transcriptional regulator [Candidatus Kaiserbacteria bacterium]|nr:helix-turn-helix transcriptional regulator [Candidatus Kaiserbacteria bacterium]MCB9812426.1 helix-turn-helix transcriptional regulator [Candidatus Nomurabacteria bacterium]